MDHKGIDKRKIINYDKTAFSHFGLMGGDKISLREIRVVECAKCSSSRIEFLPGLKICLNSGFLTISAYLSYLSKAVCVT